MVVALDRGPSPVTIAFIINRHRLAATLGGGAMARVASLLFLAVWGWSDSPPLLAAALRANREGMSG